MTEVAGLVDIAVYYAGLGIKVFPVGTSTGRKVPLTRHGFKDASDDPEKVLAMWRSGATMIGAVHDFAAIVDIDGEEGQRFFDARSHRLPKPSAVVRTRSGGMHYYYPNAHLPGSDQKRHIKKVHPEVDILAGPGGYVILPGSAGYELLSGSIESLLESK